MNFKTVPTRVTRPIRAHQIPGETKTLLGLILIPRAVAKHIYLSAITKKSFKDIMTEFIALTTLPVLCMIIIMMQALSGQVQCYRYLLNALLIIQLFYNIPTLVNIFTSTFLIINRYYALPL